MFKKLFKAISKNTKPGFGCEPAFGLMVFSPFCIKMKQKLGKQVQNKEKIMINVKLNNNFASEWNAHHLCVGQNKQLESILEKKFVFFFFST